MYNGLSSMYTDTVCIDSLTLIGLPWYSNQQQLLNMDTSVCIIIGNQEIPRVVYHFYSLNNHVIVCTYSIDVATGVLTTGLPLAGCARLHCQPSNGCSYIYGALSLNHCAVSPCIQQQMN